MNFIPLSSFFMIFYVVETFFKQHEKIFADFDLMIVSVAIKNHVTLVTNDMRHFARVKDLKIDNWY